MGGGGVGVEWGGGRLCFSICFCHPTQSSGILQLLRQSSVNEHSRAQTSTTRASPGPSRVRCGYQKGSATAQGHLRSGQECGAWGSRRKEKAAPQTTKMKRISSSYLLQNDNDSIYKRYPNSSYSHGGLYPQSPPLSGRSQILRFPERRAL